MMQLINAIYVFIRKYLQSIENSIRPLKLAQVFLFTKDPLVTADFLAGFKDFAQKIPDHRLDRNKLYSVSEILFLTLAALISGCEGWQDIEQYGKVKIKLLRKFYPYAHGIPSDDTIRRFFRALDPTKFRQGFIEWVKTLPMSENVHVAIDGKVSRHSGNEHTNPLHLVTAFASDMRLVLAQEKVDDKSNEITAIPKLVDLLDLQGAVVTIDAMGCQRGIAQLICQKEADYVLALKGNQGSLHQDVVCLFNNEVFLSQREVSTYSQVATNKHGRIEKRTYKALEVPATMQQNHHWPEMKSLLEVTSQREIKGKITQEKRYYISSLPKDAKKIGQAVRSHWSIENSLHWVLDVIFKDDDSRISQGNAPNNIGIIKHMALNLIRETQRQEKQYSVKRMVKSAGWDDGLLLKILSQIGTLEQKVA